MVTRDSVLDATERLVLAQGRVPSFAAVAREVGLTKQGVLHHFPDRAALVAALAARAVARVDAAMQRAADGGSPAETYLRLSAPTREDRAAAVVVFSVAQEAAGAAVPAVDEAVERWQSLIAAEVGDPVRAEVVRLVGDGLFAEALVTGRAPDEARLDALVAHLVPAASRTPS